MCWATTCFIRVSSGPCLFVVAGFFHSEVADPKPALLRFCFHCPQSEEEKLQCVAEVLFAAYLGKSTFSFEQGVRGMLAASMLLILILGRPGLDGEFSSEKPSTGSCWAVYCFFSAKASVLCWRTPGDKGGPKQKQCPCSVWSMGLCLGALQRHCPALLFSVTNQALAQACENRGGTQAQFLMFCMGGYLEYSNAFLWQLTL